MLYDFDHVPNRRNTNAIKWDECAEDVLPLWIADTDFPVCDKIIQRIQKRLEHPVLGYSLDNKQLIKAIQERMSRLYKWNVSEDSIMLVPGIVSGFNFGVRAFCKPGESMIFMTPVYPPFFEAPRNNQVDAITVSMDYDEKSGLYQFDAQKFESAIRSDTKMFLLCNPHNPLGRVFTKEELVQLGDICEKHNVVICSDEIHSDIIFSGHHHTPIASISDTYSQRTVTFIAPSKTFNIPGLSCSVVIIENPKVREQFAKALAGLCSFVTPLSQEAGLAAYEECGEWLTQEMKYLESNRDFMQDFITREIPQVKMNQIEGTFLAWLDFRQAGIPEIPQQYLLKEAKVFLNNGESFGGERWKDYCRFNFGTSRAILIEALERIAQSINKL